MEPEITITELESRRGGEEAVITVRIYGGEGKEETKKLTVASKMLFEIGNIGFGSIPYSLKFEEYDILTYDAQIWEAVKKAFALLSYGDNTKLTLVRKLRERGFDKYIAEDAAEYVAKLGYIDEVAILEREVDRLANVKLYGKARIRTEVYKKGISREILSEHLGELLSDINFQDNLLKLIRKKCDFSRLDDKKYRDSFYGAMYRLGYSPSETRTAIKIVTEEENE